MDNRKERIIEAIKSEDVIGLPYSHVNGDCWTCKHRDYGYKCPAFPDGIPIEIAYGLETHREIRKDQKNPIVFESRFGDK